MSLADILFFSNQTVGLQNLIALNVDPVDAAPDKTREQQQSTPKPEPPQQPAPKEYTTGGDNPATRPEQGPQVPPEEQTAGIP
ncbi:hypothetical protein [Pontibacter vulgaris]|uniref:hypothetical protein n=1 Tax=Pontibacter vulgaris TaxID=2905679 RepID=UPI001FA70AD1|nr:hypothetical protein [Pontibacter vulgaris]